MAKSPRTISTTSDTPTASDIDRILDCTNGGTTTVTLATSGFSAGDAFGVKATGGTVTFAAGSGTSSITGDTTVTVGSAVYVWYRGSGIWAIEGTDVIVPVASGGTGASTASAARANLSVAGPEARHFSAVYGDWTGVAANDTANLKAAIAAWPGSTIILPGRDVSTPVTLTETIEIPTRTVLQGPGSSQLCFKLADGVDDDVFRTEDFAALEAANAYLASEGNAVGYGLVGMWIDGNKANNSAGCGIKAWGKRMKFRDLIISHCAEHGVYMDGGTAAGAVPTAMDSIETDIDMVFAMLCDGDGFHFEGPHDAYFGKLVSNQNGGWGFYANGSSALHEGEHMHVYANANGVYLGGRGHWKRIQTEANYGVGIEIVSRDVQVDNLYLYYNHRDHESLHDAPITDFHLTVTGTGRVQLGDVWIKAEHGGTGANLAAFGTAIDTLHVDGMASAARCVLVNQSAVQIGNLMVEGATATGGLGLEIANNMQQLQIKGVATNCHTLVKFNGGTSHNRSVVDIFGNINAGQTALSGSALGLNCRMTVESSAGANGPYVVPGNRLGFFGAVPAFRAAAYTVDNVTTDRSFNANATTLDELADVVGTLIADLKTYGLLQ